MERAPIMFENEIQTEPEEPIASLVKVKPKNQAVLFRAENVAALVETKIMQPAYFEWIMGQLADNGIPKMKLRALEKEVEKRQRQVEKAASTLGGRDEAQSPLAIARRFRDEKLPTLLWYEKDWLVHRGSIYGAVEADFIRGRVYEFLEDIDGYPAAKTVNDVMDALKAVAHVERNTYSPPCWINEDERAMDYPADEILACQNGLLHLPSGKMIEPTPNFFTRNGAPFAYDPDAPEPTAWFGFLDDLWGHDPEQITLLQEVMGYLLTPDNSQQKFFYLKGVRRGGKGTIIGVIRRLLGATSICSPKLEALGSRFGLEVALGKSLAIVADMRLPKRADNEGVTSNVLRIVGGDPVDVERKYAGGAWTGVLPLRLLIATNEDLALPDHSGAIVARLIGLHMTVSFEGREDPDLALRLAPEIPGILLWAIEGWRRLRKQGRFTITAASKSLAEAVSARASPLESFLEESCVVEKGASVPRDAVWLRYQDYCGGLGIPMAYRDMGAFNSALVEASKERITVFRPGSGPNRSYHWAGLRLLPLPEEEEEQP